MKTTKMQTLSAMQERVMSTIIPMHHSFDRSAGPWAIATQYILPLFLWVYLPTHTLFVK